MSDYRHGLGLIKAMISKFRKNTVSESGMFIFIHTCLKYYNMPRSCYKTVSQMLQNEDLIYQFSNMMDYDIM